MKNEKFFQTLPFQYDIKITYTYVTSVVNQEKSVFPPFLLPFNKTLLFTTPIFNTQRDKKVNYEICIYLSLANKETSVFRPFRLFTKPLFCDVALVSIKKIIIVEMRCKKNCIHQKTNQIHNSIHELCIILKSSSTFGTYLKLACKTLTRIVTDDS